METNVNEPQPSTAPAHHEPWNDLTIGLSVLSFIYVLSVLSVSWWTSHWDALVRAALALLALTIWAGANQRFRTELVRHGYQTLMWAVVAILAASFVASQMGWCDQWSCGPTLEPHAATIIAFGRDKVAWVGGIGLVGGLWTWAQGLWRQRRRGRQTLTGWT